MLSETEVLDLNRACALTLGDDADAQWEADRMLPPDMLGLLRAGEDTLEVVRAVVEAVREPVARERDKAVDRGLLFDTAHRGFRIEAPIPRPGTVLAIGLNYREHAAESNREPPQYPMVFNKVSSCVIGPGVAIQRPRVSTMLDWEGELCVVIGRRAYGVSEEEALDYVAGYMIGNDVTVRDWQRHTPQYLMGKSFYTHGPTGPYLVTADEVADPAKLDVRTWVNEDLKQDSNTSMLIFSIPHLIAYISTAFPLEPGDVIFTGTPAGIGAARTPPEFLKAGDTVRVEITGLGSLENPVIDQP
jgi:2-keto-4-pentenoate hydratase/2-oxohepta-3-ene-1,7-dioic acid hydratase in catechol pathway